MKSWQEMIILLPRPNCNSDGKADNKQQAFINTDTRRFKIQMGDMGPPPPTPDLWQGLLNSHKEL